MIPITATPPTTPPTIAPVLLLLPPVSDVDVDVDDVEDDDDDDDEVLLVDVVLVGDVVKTCGEAYTGTMNEDGRHPTNDMLGLSAYGIVVHRGVPLWELSETKQNCQLPRYNLIPHAPARSRRKQALTSRLWRPQCWHTARWRRQCSRGMP